MGEYQVDILNSSAHKQFMSNFFMFIINKKNMGNLKINLKFSNIKETFLWISNRKIIFLLQF